MIVSTNITQYNDVILKIIIKIEDYLKFYINNYSYFSNFFNTFLLFILD